jgi:hypothetical protein
MMEKGYHEPVEQIGKKARDKHRALLSLMEKLESVDRYDQRIEVCDDDQLRTIFEHNQSEEKEHAAILLEWLRRNDATLSEELNKHLFSDKYFTSKRV